MKKAENFIHKAQQSNEEKARSAAGAIVYIQVIVLGILVAVFMPIPILGDLLMLGHEILSGIVSPAHPEKMWLFYLAVWALPTIILLGIGNKAKGRADFFDSFFNNNND